MISHRFLRNALLVTGGIFLTFAHVQATLITINNQTNTSIHIQVKQLPSGPTYYDSALPDNTQRQYDNTTKQVIFGSAPNKSVNYLYGANGLIFQKTFILPDQNATTITITPP